ncbi:hypothetical protein BXZ70DRAFT_1006526 [Cristinia sonorae]|uniref:DUF2786 domain-containing protein n=1 Tax=Cristinia sonorae TaxID=1940300 RepID=A0A8K0XRT2_9AGAR|nr:hypothetical protein BXZ70DRAFT_1006526 [Cristinia sonorae]
MARIQNKRVYSWEDSGSGEDDFAWQDSDHDEDYKPRAHSKPPPRKRVKAEAVPKSRTKAGIVLLATNVLPEQAAASERLSNVDGSIISKIKKALALASHSGTGEQEARAALRMASKLMAQHSIDQADILAEEEQSDRLKRAGMSVVVITSLVGGTVRLESWTRSTASAMGEFFDCKYYTESFKDGYRLNFCFYGLAEQTVAAAHGFEMSYNLILELSQRKKEAKGMRAKNTYRHGVGDGLYALARKEKREEHWRTVEMEKQKLLIAKREEEEEEIRRLKRLKNPQCDEDHKPAVIDGKASSSPKKDTSGFVKIEDVEGEDKATISTLNEAFQASSEKTHTLDRGWSPEQSSRNGFPDTSGQESDTSTDEENEYFFDPMDEPLQPDFRDSDDDDLYLNPPPAPPVSASTVPPPPALPVKQEIEEPGWKSVQQLVQFRATSVAIADDYLKATGLKLRTSRKDTFQLKNGERELYNEGREDAKKIDVKRKRIKDAEQD